MWSQLIAFIDSFFVDRFTRWPEFVACAALAYSGFYLAKKIFGALKKGDQKGGCGSCGCGKSQSLLKRKRPPK